MCAEGAASRQRQADRAAELPPSPCSPASAPSGRRDGWHSAEGSVATGGGPGGMLVFLPGREN